ncbi:two-component system sensor histidine kinase SenX3 [Rarobacter faecitabidus]|uniref:Sensor-like histidine kinase SenX3 n=2 Tax=Rarobacter faecitabidus TaxID=13243 RepID=A0A542ZTK7_RARFA|nr:two-component system sensor histidine kinase SenX3 [Rarobacter faecitabidus]
MSMQSPWLILVAGLLGVFVGMIAMIAFRYSEKSQTEVPERTEPELADDIIRVLAVVRSAVIVLGPGDVVLRASPAAYALGMVRGEYLVHDQVREVVEQVRATGEIVDEELELQRGSQRDLVIVGVRVAYLTNEVVVIFAEDHTQARRIEQIRQDFSVNVSHELKTPVGAISLLAETLESAANDPEAVRRFAGKTKQEAVRLAALVHDLIELSRLQSASALMDVRLVEVDDVIAQAAEDVRVIAQGREQDITLPEASTWRVYGDEALLVAAIRNLLTNASAYSPKNSSIQIALSRKDGMVGIEVLDHGIGLSEQDQERIFERFYRSDPARARDTGGTGLGLSIVKHIAQDHGGQITVWSAPGQGSTFTLWIPESQEESDSHHNDIENEEGNRSA